MVVEIDAFQVKLIKLNFDTIMPFSFIMMTEKTITLHTFILVLFSYLALVQNMVTGRQ